jgi:hypothetical protein
LADVTHAVIDGATNQEFAPIDNGHYAVEISFYDCVDTSECAYIVTLDLIDRESKNKISVFPNPFDDYTTINFGELLQERHTIIISNVLGQEVYRNENVTGINLKIKKEQLGVGVYILSLFNADSKELFSTKLLVE